MKTRESIEAQSVDSASATPKKRHPNSLKNLVAPWKPGQSGNPAGKPKQDMSQIIARAIFEKNPELIYKAYATLLMKGSAFGFQVVAERAFGKLKETRDTGSDFNEVPDNDIQAEIDKLYARLGLKRAADAAAEAGVASARAEKANGAAKDHGVLPR
jgi:hypothetical protein